MKKRSGISKITVLIVIIYYILGILALVAHEIGLSTSDYNVFAFWHNQIWDTLAPVITVGSIIGVIPYFIFNIIGMIKEKRILIFLICFILPFFMWLLVMATATAYF